jgi:deoxycytidine triphosphate deaminase
MLGTIVNNTQLKALQESRRIYIRPFEEKSLKTIHYPLTATKFLECAGRDGKKPRFNLKYDEGYVKAEFGANEYLVAQMEQTIELQDGIVGHFVPFSKLIDYGFGLTCGRIEAPYGQNGEVIRFGVKNQLNLKNVLARNEVIAYVYFIDLRALSNLKFELSAEERELFARWQKKFAYAQEDGIHPMDD